MRSIYVLLVLAAGSVVALAADKGSPVSIERVELLEYRGAKPQGAADAVVKPAVVGAKPGMAKPAPVIQQSKQLKITLRKSSSSEFQSELVVKYWMIGRDSKTQKPLGVSSGQSEWNVKPADRGKEVLSEPYQGSYTLKSPAPAKKPGASAQPGADAGAGSAEPAAISAKVAGYGVQVLLAGKVVAEQYSEAAFKAGIESGAISQPASKRE
jgi:hypothetical protein